MRLVKRSLWLLNAGLSVAVVVFAMHYFVFPQQDNPLETVEIDRPGIAVPPPPPDYAPLKNMSNPVELQRNGPPNFQAALTGTNPGTDPAWIWAYLVVQGRNVPVTAYFDEPVISEGVPVPELQGWKLKRVTGSSATFSNGQKEETINTGGMGPVPATGERGKIQALARTNDRETYGVDRNTIAWAIENQEKILSEIGLQDYSSGGIQVTSIALGSIASEAGLQQYDVIKSMNGSPIANSISLAELRNNPQMKNQQSMVIGIERGGQVKTIVIQPTQR